MKTSWLLFLITTCITAVNSSESVMVWGSEAQQTVPYSRLTNITQIVGGKFSFAAVSNGELVVWGDGPANDSTTVNGILSGVHISKITPSKVAFAALLQNGTVVTWGNPVFNVNTVPSMRDVIVKDIYATSYAFAFLKSDGSVSSWGLDFSELGYKGYVDVSTVQHLLIDVKDIYTSPTTFAALTSQRTIVSWGRLDGNFGGDSSTVSEQLQNVSSAVGNFAAFAAILQNGDVVAWGMPLFGGNISTVKHLLKNVTSITTTPLAFAAQTSNGDVVTWGVSFCGGYVSDPEIQKKLKNVKSIVSTTCSFGAVTSDDSVVVWGNMANNTSTVKSLLKSVSALYATNSSYVALTTSNTVVAWGSSNMESSDTSTVNHLLNNKHINITSITSTSTSFAATYKVEIVSEESKTRLILIIVLCSVLGLLFVCLLVCCNRRSKILINSNDDGEDVALFTMDLSMEWTINKYGTETVIESVKTNKSFDTEIPNECLSDFNFISNSRFGKNYTATYTTCREVVAVRQSKTSFYMSLLEEVNMLCNIRQKDIIKYYGWSRTDDGIRIVMQHCEEGSLYEYLKRHPPSNRARFSLKMLSIARGIAFIHTHGLAHMDISTHSILISKGELLVGDMGAIHRTGSVIKSELLIPFCPPETLSSSQPRASHPHDVWSLACTVYEILSGIVPYSDKVSSDNSGKQLIKLIKLNNIPTRPSDLSELGENIFDFLVQHCWTDPINRVSVKVIITSFQNLIGETPQLITIPQFDAAADIYFDYKSEEGDDANQNDSNEDTQYTYSSNTLN